jgi:hypothetical protein
MVQLVVGFMMDKRWEDGHLSPNLLTPMTPAPARGTLTANDTTTDYYAAAASSTSSSSVVNMDEKDDEEDEFSAYREVLFFSMIT